MKSLFVVWADTFSAATQQNLKYIPPLLKVRNVLITQSF